MAEEDTNRDRIRRVINDEVKLPKTGIITEVHEHQEPEDNWNFHVDVRIGPDRHPREVPVAVPAPDLISPPRSDSHPEGPDLALIQYIDGVDGFREIVTHILYNNEDRPPIGEEGVYRLQRGELYLEAHPTGDWARIAKKSEDGSEPSALIELDDSDDQVVANIDADEVVLGGGGDGVITDVVANTSTSDGYVTSVNLEITRSEVTETE